MKNNEHIDPLDHVRATEQMVHLNGERLLKGISQDTAQEIYKVVIQPRLPMPPKK